MGLSIVFAPSLYGGILTLGGSELPIDKNITIDATGANITIDADQKSRVFNIAEGATVELVGLTITGGTPLTVAMLLPAAGFTMKAS